MQRAMQGQANIRWAREAAKWGADFMAKSVEEDRVLLHIGDIKKDHAYMGRAEDYPDIDRNVRFCNSGAICPWLRIGGCPLHSQWHQCRRARGACRLSFRSVAVEQCRSSVRKMCGRSIRAAYDVRPGTLLNTCQPPRDSLAIGAGSLARRAQSALTRRRAGMQASALT